MDAGVFFCSKLAFGFHDVRVGLHWFRSRAVGRLSRNVLLTVIHIDPLSQL